MSQFELKVICLADRAYVSLNIKPATDRFLAHCPPIVDARPPAYAVLSHERLQVLDPARFFGALTHAGFRISSHLSITGSQVTKSTSTRLIQLYNTEVLFHLLLWFIHHPEENEIDVFERFNIDTNDTNGGILANYGWLYAFGPTFMPPQGTISSSQIDRSEPQPLQIVGFQFPTSDGSKISDE